MARKKTAKIIDFSSYSGYIVNNSINEEEKVKKKNRKEKNKVNRSNSRRTKNKSRGKSKAIIFLLILLIIAAVYVCLFTPLFNINSIQIQYNDENITHLINEEITEESNIRLSKYTDDELINMSNLKIGNNIFKENMKKAEQSIMSAPYVKIAKINRKLPDKVIITIDERTIRAYVDYVGSYVCIDEEGYVLDTIKKEEKQFNIPIIYGISPKDIVKGFTVGEKLDADDSIKLDRLVLLFSLSEKNDILSNISSIDISDKDNMNVNLNDEKITVKFGDMSNMTTKIQYLEKILQDVGDKKGVINMTSSDNDFKPVFAEKIGG